MKLESSIRDHAGMLYAAPVLDVVLLIMVFFLLGSSLVLRSGIPVSIPSSSASLPPFESTHVITVLPGTSPQIYFNENKIRIDELPRFLEESPPEIRHVIIRADRFAPFGIVIDISNVVKQYRFELAYATKSDH